MRTKSSLVGPDAETARVTACRHPFGMTTPTVPSLRLAMPHDLRPTAPARCSALFFRAYVKTALFNSIDAAGLPLSDQYGAQDLPSDVLIVMQRHCDRFYAAQSDEWQNAGLCDQSAGRDFWLSRNRHTLGGFHKRHLGYTGDRLAHAAMEYVEGALAVAADGRLYAVYGPRPCGALRRSLRSATA